MKDSDLTILQVTPSGVIIVPGIAEPHIRADVFERVDPHDVHCCEDLICLVQACQPLSEHMRHLGDLYLSDVYLQDALALKPASRSTPGATQRRTSERKHHLDPFALGRQQLIVRMLQREPEEGWKHWIELSGDTLLQDFVQIVHDWLQEDIDWSEYEHFDAIWNGQQAALAYLAELESSTLQALGVRIIDGEYPGSNFCAAKLKKSIAQANEAAHRLGLEFRFVAVCEISAELGRD